MFQSPPTSMVLMVPVMSLVVRMFFSRGCRNQCLYIKALAASVEGVAT